MDFDEPGLERLAQRVESQRMHLGRLVDEQDATMRAADGARPGHARPTADEADQGGSVMRGDERRPDDQLGIVGEQTGE